MSKTFRYDPDSNSGSGLSKGDRKRLKTERKLRRTEERILDSHMTPDDTETNDAYLDGIMQKTRRDF